MRVLDRFEIKRRGTVIVVPYSGGPVPARELAGHYVNERWKIVGVETFAILRPPGIGDPIGLALSDAPTYPNIDDQITIV